MLGDLGHYASVDHNLAERRSIGCGGAALGFLGLGHIVKMTRASSFLVTHASIFLGSGSSKRSMACDPLATGIDYAYF
jgi:hypothetical protein